MYRLRSFCQFGNSFKVAFMLRALPGWALPYDILPGERLLPKW